MFNQPLYQGMRTPEVYSLQVVLKVTPATGYFGPITKAAVVKFQQSQGIDAIGIVGPLTRAKLNALAAAPSVAPVAPTAPLKPVVVKPPTIQTPTIESITPTSGSYETVITLRGSGFALTGNKVHTGFDTLYLASPDTKTIMVPINSPGFPQYRGDETDVIWELWLYVENNNGQSNVQIFNFKPYPNNL